MEDLITEKNDLYSLPLHKQANLKWSFHLLFGFSVTLLLGFILIPGDDSEKFILNLIFSVFMIFILYGWLALAFFKKPYLIINDEYLEYKWLFGRKRIDLGTINQIEFYSESGVTRLGIGAIEHGKLSFFEATDRMLGRNYSVSIVVSTFSNIDFEKLRLTLIAKVNQRKQ
ncbi:hypothetical protein [Paenibacillus luteus]|uniref:hypothetical protein n=1 Tax=Paenibacillus luteus TaxID=2545753 RepID=UPI0011438269|nr:hypothetical protein [Paenibacillus luteus]